MSAHSSLACSDLTRAATIPLGMAQLAYRGLSEDWWLRHLGDVHWQLIADAVGQHTTVFRDAQGRQIYAAFCATEFDQPNPDLAGLGHKIDVHSTLWSAGKSRIQSNHSLCIEGAEVARFTLVSTFVVHMKTGVNASVARATPYLIPVLQPAPDEFAQDMSILSKQQRHDPDGPPNGITLRPSVGSDFNAVGLLYFPSFTRLFEQIEDRCAPSVGWSPVHRRRVIYFSNIEMGEKVTGAMSSLGPHPMTLWRMPSESAEAKKLAYCLCTRH